LAAALNSFRTGSMFYNVCGTPEVLRNEMKQNLGAAKRNLATAVVRCAARSDSSSLLSSAAALDFLPL
jgi:hypothetical protein